MRILFSFILLVGALSPAWGKTTVLYHTSDTHGYYYPVRGGPGGFAALAGLLKAESRPYLLLDSGDFASGNWEAQTSQGMLSVEMMNRLGYDAVTLGNHEYDFGDAALQRMLKTLKMPVLDANLYQLQNGVAALPAAKMFEVDGVRVAVIGLGSEKIKSAQYKAGDFVRSLQNTLQKLYGEPCLPGQGLETHLCQAVQQQTRPQVVVLLAHNSPDDWSSEGGRFLKELPSVFAGKIHIVLGGHVHQQIAGRELNGVYEVESGYGLSGVSRIEIITDDTTGAFISAKTKYVILDPAKTGEDKELADYLASVRHRELDYPVGILKDDLFYTAQRKTQRDSTLGNWLADAIRRYSGAEVAVVNNGSMRRMNIPAGLVTARDLRELLPYNNKIVRFPISGALLFELVVQEMQRPVPLMSFSGLKAVYYPGPEGENSTMRLRVNGRDIDENQTYLLATNDYLANGFDIGELFKQIPSAQKTFAGEKNLREVLEDELGKGVRAPDTGRMRVK